MSDADSGVDAGPSANSFKLSEAKALRRELKAKPSLAAVRKLITAVGHLRRHLNGDSVFDESRVVEVILASCTGHGAAAFAAAFQLHALTVAGVRRYAKRNCQAEGKKDGALKPALRLSKAYLTEFSQILGELSDGKSEKVLVEHLIHMVPLCSLFHKQSTFISKKLLKMWCSTRSSSEPAGKMLVELARAHTSMLFDRLIKGTFTELCQVDPLTTFRHSFLYIRQIAIHVRNATLQPRKEKLLEVFSWPPVMCLYLWADVVVGMHRTDANMASLLYPLTQVIVAIARLSPLQRSIPVKLHCIRLLTALAEATGQLTPATSVCLEVLHTIPWRKRFKAGSLFSPHRLQYMIKFSQSHLEEQRFVVSTVEEVLRLLLEAVHCLRHSNALQDFIAPVVWQLKAIAKVHSHNREVEKLTAFANRLKAEMTYRQTECEKLPWNLAHVQQEPVLPKALVGGSPLAKWHHTETEAKLRALEILQHATAHGHLTARDAPSHRKRPAAAAATHRSRSAKRKKSHVSNEGDQVFDLDLSQLELN